MWLISLSLSLSLSLWERAGVRVLQAAPGYLWPLTPDPSPGRRGGFSGWLRPSIPGQ